MTHRVLVQLDCLVDTVLGTASLLNPSWVEQLLKASYTHRNHNRLKELCPSVDMALFKKAYDLREVSTLAHSRMTMLILHFINMQETFRLLPDGHPEKIAISLTVNYWPYKLSDSQIQEYQDVLMELIPGLTEIPFIDISPTAMSPKYVKQRFDHLYLYDLSAWLGLHTASLDNQEMKGVVVSAPVIVIEGTPSEEELEELRQEIPFFTAPMFELELLDLSIMSYCDPDRVVNRTPETDTDDK